MLWQVIHPSQATIGLASAAIVVVVGLLGGCVERTITITSDPSGALVHLNDEEVGRTPLTVPFTFYGTYDVRLEAEGHDPLWTQQRAAAPLMEHPGLDLINEAIPNNKVELHWHFTLQPTPEEVDESGLADRGRQLRALLRQSMPEPPESSAP